MAGNLSKTAEKYILEHSVGKATWTKPTSVYVGLFTTLPQDNAVEVSPSSSYTGELTLGSGSKGYTRAEAAPAKWGTAQVTGTAMTISNTDAITFPTATESWGSVVGVGIFNAATGGELIWLGPLTSSKTVAAQDTFQFGIGALSLSLD